MSQAFEVRLIDAGPNRLPVLARIRPLLGEPPERCRSLVQAGNLVVARDLGRSAALALTAELCGLGARAEAGLCGCGCSDGPDHLA